MDLKLHAKFPYSSVRLNTTISGDISCSLLLKTSGMTEHPYHTQWNPYNDEIVAYMDVQLHYSNQQNNLTINIWNTFQKYWQLLTPEHLGHVRQRLHDESTASMDI